MGVLGWTPKTFWKSTPYEFRAAFDGWQEKNGGKRHRAAPLTQEELAELMALYPDPED